MFDCIGNCHGKFPLLTQHIVPNEMNRFRWPGKWREKKTNRSKSDNKLHTDNTKIKVLDVRVMFPLIAQWFFFVWFDRNCLKTDSYLFKTDIIKRIHFPFGNLSFSRIMHLCFSFTEHPTYCFKKNIFKQYRVIGTEQKINYSPRSVLYTDRENVVLLS